MCSDLRNKVACALFFLVECSFCTTLGNAYEVLTVVDGGSIAGRVKFAGRVVPPRKVEVSKDQNVCGKTEKIDETLLIGEDFGLQNVLVSLLDIQKGKGFTDSSPILDQRACQYIPHLVLVPVGKPLTILNNDGVLHSVHAHGVKNPAFNRAQSKFKKEIRESFSYPEIVKLTCDVHSWMSGWIIVQEHPYMTVSGEDGSFEITEIPPGKYKVRFWHEFLGEEHLLVLIGASERVVVHIKMSR